MWAPVPPEIEYTQTRRSAARPLRGATVRQKAADSSVSSSRPSTRTTPYWRNTPSMTRSLPVRCPVWLAAMERPASVLPTLTATMGTPRDMAASAASCTVRPSLKPST